MTEPALTITTRLKPSRRLDLDVLVNETGWDWSANHVINRAIRDMLVLYRIHEEQAAAAPRPHGDLLLRIVRDFGSAMLVNRTLGYGHDRDGDPLISATAKDTGEKSLFYEDQYNRLMVQRTTGDLVEHFVISDGELTLVDTYPAPGAAVLN
jgi:hypothetical protein